MTDQPLQLDIDTMLSKHDPENKLDAYYRVLKLENEQINLVSRETIKNHLPLLSAESLLPFEYINKESFCNYLDIGSGGGIPSLPILLTKNINQAKLAERIGKKADALGRMALNLETSNVEVINKTVEDCKFEMKFDLITMRLVKLTDRLFKNISRTMSKNSVFIYYYKPEFQIDTNSFSVVTRSYSISPTSDDKFFTLIIKK